MVKDWLRVYEIDKEGENGFGTWKWWEKATFSGSLRNYYVHHWNLSFWVCPVFGQTWNIRINVVRKLKYSLRITKCVYVCVCSSVFKCVCCSSDIWMSEPNWIRATLQHLSDGWTPKTHLGLLTNGWYACVCNLVMLHKTHKSHIKTI